MFQFLFFFIVLVGYYVGFSSLSYLLRKNGEHGFKIAGIGIGLTAAISQLVIDNVMVSASVAVGTWLFAIGSLIIRKSTVNLEDL